MRIRAQLFGIVATATMLGLVGCMKWGEDSDDDSLKNSFKEVMGFDQPATATNTKSSYYWVRDSYIKWLSFSCDDATILKIKHLEKGPQKREGYWRNSGGPGRHDGANPNAPTWWKNAPDESGMEEYDIDRSKPERNSDIVRIWIDSANHTVYATRDVTD